MSRYRELLYKPCTQSGYWKLNRVSGKSFLKSVLIYLSIYSFSLFCHSQPSQQETSYLDHSLLLTRYLSDNAVDTTDTLFDSQPFNNTQSNIENGQLEELDLYQFTYIGNSCYIDPFASIDKSEENKQQLVNCLKGHLWENKRIPFWLRATGATVLIGAAGSAGKLDDDLKLSIDFDEMDNILRNWLDND